jgi:hypothetical protein
MAANPASGRFPVSQMDPTKLYFCGFHRAPVSAHEFFEFRLHSRCGRASQTDSAKGYETPLRLLSLGYNRIIVIRQIEGAGEF